MGLFGWSSCEGQEFAVAELFPPGRFHRRKAIRHAALLASKALFESLENRLLFARVLGIDISSHQPASINWTQVKTGNAATNAPAYGWALAKATEGTQFHDPSFAGYMSGAHAAGIPSGAY